MSLRILWHSNAPWTTTGYANQTGLFVPRLQALGHTVHVSAFYGLQGRKLRVDKDTVMYPGGMHPYGNDVIASHAADMKADIVITLIDAWVFTSEATSRIRWCPWMPVDHDPLPPPVKAALASAWQPIAYSKFGEAKLQEAGFDPRYVPHGVDTKVFHPIDRAEARKALGWPEDGFVAVMVAANRDAPSRKALPEVLWAWSQFVKRHPGATLYMHTWGGPPMTGIDLPQLLSGLDLPERSVLLADPYQYTVGYPDFFLVNAYNAANVVLSPSYGEGFGLPIVEAQACGTPVIVGDNSSMSELCFSGWKVKGQPFWTQQGSWMRVPFIAEIEQALETAWMKRGYPQMRKAARDGALGYDVDRVTERYWKPVLEELAQNIDCGELELVDPLAVTA